MNLDESAQLLALDVFRQLLVKKFFSSSWTDEKAFLEKFAKSQFPEVAHLAKLLLAQNNGSIN